MKSRSKSTSSMDIDMPKHIISKTNFQKNSNQEIEKKKIYNDLLTMNQKKDEVNHDLSKETNNNIWERRSKEL